MKIRRVNRQGGGRQQPTLLFNASLIISLFVPLYPAVMLSFPTAFKHLFFVLLAKRNDNL